MREPAFDNCGLILHAAEIAISDALYLMFEDRFINGPLSDIAWLAEDFQYNQIEAFYETA